MIEKKKGVLALLLFTPIMEKHDKVIDVGLVTVRGTYSCEWVVSHPLT
ncbi:hypothetical protein ACE1TI_01415 [Alteribacillus sp. JSM 102045]